MITEPPTDDSGFDPWVSMMWKPSEEETQAEEAYWSFQDTQSEVCEFQAREAEAMSDFTTWPLADLEEELELAKVLTPDLAHIIAELEDTIAQRKGEAA